MEEKHTNDLRNKQEPKKAARAREEIAKKLLQIIFEEYGSEGVSVDDVKLITQEMVGRMKATPMVLDS